MLYFNRSEAYYRVPATGGEPEAVTSPPTGGESRRSPDVLPDGRGLLLTVLRGGPDQSRIAVVGPEGGEVREILTGTMARYAASGHVVYATADGTLMAAPFDLERLEVTGPSVALLGGVQVKPSSVSPFALSETGTLLYKTGAFANRLEFVWVTRSGEVSPVNSDETFTWSTGRNDGLRLSPDGRHVAFSNGPAENSDIWTKELPDGPMSPLTFDDDLDQLPSWTPDGENITFGSQRGLDIAIPGATVWRLWTQPANGAGEAELAYGSLSFPASEGVWSPDGRWLVMRRSSTSQSPSRDILALRPGVDSVATSLTETRQFNEHYPAISRDGRWLAYASNETGSYEVFVQPFPNVSDGEWQISTGGGVEPVWAHNGRELFFLDPTTFELKGAEFSTTADSFQRGRITTLFTAPEGPLSRLLRGGVRAYDVALDDERFLMTRAVESDEGPASVVVVQNFFEELKARVPN